MSEVADARQLALDAFDGVQAAEDRLRMARDEAARLRAHLVDAEQAVATAERDHRRASRTLEGAWALFRESVGRAGAA